jgi:hypothetical protein
MPPSSGSLPVPGHYNSLRSLFYTYFIYLLNIEVTRNPNARNLRKVSALKTETGDASLSGNTARFRKKVATLI